MEQLGQFCDLSFKVFDGLCLRFYGFEAIQFCFDFVELVFDVIIVIADHGIDKDRVDEGHSDNAAYEEKDAKIDANNVFPDGAIHILSDGIWDVVPSFDGE